MRYKWTLLKDRLKQRLNFLTRSDCILCGFDIAEHYTGLDDKHTIIDLCTACQEQLKLNLICCDRCALPLDNALANMLNEPSISSSETALCGSCQTLSPKWQRAIATFRYDYPVDKLLIALKYNGRIDYARTLARLMARDLRTCYELEINTTERPDCLLPVPLHINREAGRGYNQATLLAKELSKQLNIPINTKLIKRTRHTPMQSSLSKEHRTQNLQGAFSIKQNHNIPRYVALIDDVMTTGSTANIISQTLLNAGVERVDVWCCARAE